MTGGCANKFNCLTMHIYTVQYFCTAHWYATVNLIKTSFYLNNFMLEQLNTNFTGVPRPLGCQGHQAKWSVPPHRISQVWPMKKFVWTTIFFSHYILYWNGFLCHQEVDNFQKIATIKYFFIDMASLLNAKFSQQYLIVELNGLEFKGQSIGYTVQSISWLVCSIF